MVWRTRNEEFDPKCTIPTVKHDGGSVMVWECFTKLGVGKLYVLDHTMGRFYYQQILFKNLLDSVKQLRLGTNFIFMHDNDPKHTSAYVKDWLLLESTLIYTFFSRLSFPRMDLDILPHINS